MTPRRKRSHIPICELLASALAERLPAEQRDTLRKARVKARAIIRLFTPDHVVLHAFDGKDKWWNLTMTLRGPELKAKDSSDTSKAAKVKRLAKARADLTHFIATGEKPPTPGQPKAKIKSRGFGPGHRPLRGRNSFERRA